MRYEVPTYISTKVYPCMNLSWYITAWYNTIYLPSIDKYHLAYEIKIMPL